jgi:hypothetical protein
MKLMHVEVIVQDSRLHDLLGYLESIKGYNVQVRAFKNSAGPEPEKKKVSRNIREMSRLQQEWVAKHVKDETTHAELRDAWGKTEFTSTGLYGALNRAITNKVIKKMASGNYKPTGGA